MAPTTQDESFDPAGLVAAVQELSLAGSAQEIHRLVGRTARRLLRSNGTNLVLAEGSLAHYVDEDGAGPAWKGRRIPLESTVAGWCVRQRQAVAVADVGRDIRLPVAPYWSTPVESLLAVPVRSRAPIGALLAYWARPHAASTKEVRLLQALADAASVALESTLVRSSLEDRVRRRTVELEEANRRLQREIAERRRAEEEVRQLSLVDELTGLYNRRGFNLLAGRELRSLQRSGRRGLVVYIDLDGLKQTNDQKGHEAGDRLLQRAASMMRSVTRETDVAARIGGDEFAVFMTLGYDHPAIHLIVERYLSAARSGGIAWSVGATATPPGRTVPLEDLLLGADEAMYRGRRARRGARPLAVRS